MDRLNITKTSWGIVLLYNIYETDQFNRDQSNTFKIKDNIFFNIDKKKIDDLAFKYLSQAIESILQFVKNGKPICFFIDLEYNFCHYQPEGMYFMFRKWYFEKHNMEVPPINVYYDKESNRYIFPDLE